MHSAHRDNREHYDARYRDFSVNAIVEKASHPEAFIRYVTRQSIGWRGIYHGDFIPRLRSARVLELGAGDGLNSLVMAGLGAAEVVAIDISDEAVRLVRAAAARLGLEARVQAIAGDFADMSLSGGPFDFVVGKSVLHHLTETQERLYLRKTARVLCPAGEGRFFEPAVNSRVLDLLRWSVPVPGRPSSLQRRAFERWRQSDPHPDRDNSSTHYEQIGRLFFRQVQITPLGGMERFQRLLPQDGAIDRWFRRGALQVERRLPLRVHRAIARSQAIIFRYPRA